MTIGGAASSGSAGCSAAPVSASASAAVQIQVVVVVTVVEAAAYGGDQAITTQQPQVVLGGQVLRLADPRHQLAERHHLALVTYGVPEGVITDKGKQFTDRSGKHGTRNGDVLSDKICRKNGITHRLTKPASPNQNGKVERFHGTFRPDFLDLVGPFTSVEEAQVAVDVYRVVSPAAVLDGHPPGRGDGADLGRLRPHPRADRGTRIKTVRSHLSVVDLANLVSQGAVPASSSPLPPAEDGDAIEVERCVSRLGLVSLGGKQVLAAEILGGRRVGIRIEPATLMFYDLESRELLRTRKNPLTHDQVNGLKGQRPAGPPPRPSTEPVRVQRRLQRRGDHGRRTKGRPRPCAQAPDRHRAGLRHHAGDRARRRRHRGRTSHDYPTGA